MDLTQTQLLFNRRNNAANMLRGCYNRLCVSRDMKELPELLTASKYHIKSLISAQMNIIESGVKITSHPAAKPQNFDSLLAEMKNHSDEKTLVELSKELFAILQTKYEETMRNLEARSPEADRYE